MLAGVTYIRPIHYVFSWVHVQNRASMSMYMILQRYGCAEYNSVRYRIGASEERFYIMANLMLAVTLLKLVNEDSGLCGLPSRPYVFLQTVIQGSNGKNLQSRPVVSLPASLVGAAFAWGRQPCTEVREAVAVAYC